MLKLEKIAKSREIVIELRENHGFFSRPLLQAFAIALGLHLFAGILFEVRPFIILGSQQVLPPIEVEADAAPALQGAVTALLDREDMLPRAIPPPKRPEPTASNYALATFRGSLRDAPSSLFTSLEDRLELINFGDRETAGPAVEVRIAGPLAEKTLLASSAEDVPVAKGAGRLIYSVRLDNKSGTLFWYEELEPVSDKKQRSYADRILRGLRFQGDAAGIVTAGEIEIHFRGGSG